MPDRFTRTRGALRPLARPRAGDPPRRTFLKALAAVGAVGAVPSLAACSSGSRQTITFYQ